MEDEAAAAAAAAAAAGINPVKKDAIIKCVEGACMVLCRERRGIHDVVSFFIVVAGARSLISSRDGWVAEGRASGVVRELMMMNAKREGDELSGGWIGVGDLLQSLRGGENSR